MAELLEVGAEPVADLSEVLEALRDATRRSILLTLVVGEQSCGSFGHLASKTALSYHFAVLRKAGLTHTRRAGARKLISLRMEELQRAFPGLLEAVLDGTRREQ